MYKAWRGVATSISCPTTEGCADVMGENVVELIVWSGNTINNFEGALIINLKPYARFNLLEKLLTKWILITLIKFFILNTLNRTENCI